MININIISGGNSYPLNSYINPSTIVSAEQKVTLLGEDVVNIKVKSGKVLDFGIGDRISVFGSEYTLNRLPQVLKTGERSFEYDYVFEGVQYALIDVQFMLPSNTMLDSFTGNIGTFLQFIVDNANRVYPNKWARGDFPANSTYKTLSYSGKNCLEVLQNICEEWKNEFVITTANGVNTIAIKKAGSILPYTFMYGNAKGLYNITRDNISEKNIITRLFAYGGSDNLGSRYRHNRLCLPTKQKNASYVEDTDNIAFYGIRENTKVFDDVFPNRYGSATEVSTDINSFVDSTMFDLNETDANGTKWLINGVTAKINFTSGSLAGYVFDVKSYNHSTHTITIVPFKDANGLVFPSVGNTTFRIVVGDKYFISDIMLPDSYITEAENALLANANAYLEQYKEPQVQYSVDVDKRYLAKMSGVDTVANIFTAGDYIHIIDRPLMIDKNIRVISFTRNILDDYSYSITLGDTATKETITRVIGDLQQINKVVEINNLADVSQAKRNWMTTQELKNSVFDTEGHYFSEKIKPLSIETSMLSVGSRSQQLTVTGALINTNYNGNKNTVYISSRIGGVTLTHYTIEDAVRSWNILGTTPQTITLTDDTLTYYIYAKCAKATGSTAGSFFISSDKITVTQDAIYYHFLLGNITKVYHDAGSNTDVRDVALSYGSSTISGRNITTGRISSSGGGNTYFDIDSGEIGGKIKMKDGIVSGLIGIADRENNINAGLSGEETAADDVRIWVGNTAANRNRAPFKVLASGKTILNNAEVSGEINAESGTIGALTISGETLTADDDRGSIFFRKIGNGYFKVISAIGHNVFPGSVGQRCLARFENYDEVYSHNLALNVGAKNGRLGNTAISITGGSIAGLAYDVEIIDTNYVLLQKNVYVYCQNRSPITVTFPAPDNTNKGKVYYIYRGNNGAVNLVGESFVVGGIVQNGGSIGTIGHCALLISTGSVWVYNYMPFR